MDRRSAIFSMLALAARPAFAQAFPSRALTLICPLAADTTPDQHLRGLARIASKYLGQPVNVENRQGANATAGPATMAANARPDGYTLTELLISAYRVPHMTKVNWDPIKDFTYVIGIAALTFGVVVKADSPFKTIHDLIGYGKENPGKLRYSGFVHASTQHLNMVELGLKTGARFTHIPGNYAESAKALMDGRIMAISDSTVWGPQVDDGTFRLLVTFGELRSRWNAPTAMEAGLGILSYSPFGIVGPKGMDPKVTRVLHDAFNKALDDPEYAPLLSKLDLVDWYKSSEDYAEWAVDQFRFQRGLIERTIGLGSGLR